MRYQDFQVSAAPLDWPAAVSAGQPLLPGDTSCVWRADGPNHCEDSLSFNLRFTLRLAQSPHRKWRSRFPDVDVSAANLERWTPSFSGNARGFARTRRGPFRDLIIQPLHRSFISGTGQQLHMGRCFHLVAPAMAANKAPALTKYLSHGAKTTQEPGPSAARALASAAPFPIQTGVLQRSTLTRVSFLLASLHFEGQCPWWPCDLSLGFPLGRSGRSSMPVLTPKSTES